MQRLRSECIACLVRGHMENFPEDTPENIKREYMQKFMRILADAEPEDSAPILLDRINKVRKSIVPQGDGYADIKKHFNEVMLSYESSIREKIYASQDPLTTALQYSMVGNFIDFGAMKNVDEKELRSLMSTASEIAMSEDELEKLKNDLKNCKNLVLLTDNCGEIVMDKLLLELIEKLYPAITASVIVRGEAVINDATIEDAYQIGLSEKFNVIGNGTGVAGTDLKQISEQARSLMEKADVILAKGQGNFETLHYCGLNIYYIFLCKCDMFSSMFSVDKFTGILVNEKSLNKYFNAE